jgi:hypothetical protein
MACWRTNVPCANRDGGLWLPHLPGLAAALPLVAINDPLYETVLEQSTHTLVTELSNVQNHA